MKIGMIGGIGPDFTVICCVSTCAVHSFPRNSSCYAIYYSTTNLRARVLKMQVSTSIDSISEGVLQPGRESLVLGEKL